MSIDLLLGLQWGDEGKGKIVDVLTSGYKIIARFQGGPNAGHTLVFNGKTHVLHTIPSGIFHKNKINIIGNGVVIDPVILRNELKNLDAEGIDYKKSLLISRKAHLILPTHRLLDAASEKSKGKNKIGSTLKGIGPAYMDKTGRNGFRVGDLDSKNWKEKYSELKSKHKRLIDYYNVNLDYNFDDLEKEFFESIKNLKDLNFIDSEEYIQQEQNKGNSILAEGAQGSLLDIDFGTYPFVTSSNTTAAGACTGLGVSPNSIKEVFGIFKAYTTRVGSGPFPTELFDSNGERMGKVGNEFGATTGRSRRCGWLDLVALKYSCQINGVTKLMMMKSDVLSGFKSIKVCTSYEYKAKEIRYMPYDISDSSLKPIYEEFEGWDDDITRINDFDKLPVNLKKYISYIEKVLNIPITVISVGPDRLQTIIV
ncbi:MAG: adenylosuccinate synthase [Flavobacteriaceae bacterium]|jgi:adenylosuccinate synthase|nr:adenylosuccinate synthase [Flavobacteriaceae bacterium]